MNHRTLLFAAAVTTLVVVVAFLLRAFQNDSAASYTDSPFAQVSKAYRRLASSVLLDHASQDEREAVRAAREDRYARARTLAERVLRENPQSIPGMYALAQVEAFGEGDLPYGLFLIRRARRILEERGSENRYDDDAREWYIRVLNVEHWVLAQMDRREEQLRVLEILGQVDQPMPWYEIWPLIKLRRFDAAREKIDWCLRNDRSVSRALNSLCALEDKMHHREASYAAGKEMARRFPDSALLWHNLGLAADCTFRFDEAEQAFLKSATMGRPNFYGTSYVPLARIYIQQGRLTEALDALRRGQSQRAERELYSLQQDEANMELAKSELMLAFGQDELAERFARRAAQTPDRAGSTSLDQKDVDFSNALVLWNVLQLRRQQLREHAVAKCGVGQWMPDPQAKLLDAELWQLTRRLRKLLSGDLLVNVLRPHPPGAPGFETGVASFRQGSVVQILPSGVAAAAVRRARSKENHPAAAPYLDALEAEAALRLGRQAKSLELAEQALSGLPVEGEKLLRARVTAVAGEAARRLGRYDKALVFWDTTLRDFPQAFRLLDIVIPVDIQHDGSPMAQRLATSLARSPRLQVRKRGFPVMLRTMNNCVVFEMFRRQQSRHFEGQIEIKGPIGQAAAEGAVQFHNCLMRPLIDLSQKDISSLDGSLEAVRLRGRVDEILGTRPATPINFPDTAFR